MSCHSKSEKIAITLRKNAIINKKIQIGVIGFGTVGSGVVRILRERPELLRRKAGVDLAVPEGARVIDLAGKRLLPGYIAADAEPIGIVAGLALGKLVG